MQISLSEFEQKYAENDLRIAFIGMSNIGKSYTAKRLSERFNFDLIEVDKIIWEKLGQGSMRILRPGKGSPIQKDMPSEKPSLLRLKVKQLYQQSKGQ